MWIYICNGNHRKSLLSSDSMEQGWFCLLLHSCCCYLLLTITLLMAYGVETSKWQLCFLWLHFLFCAMSFILNYALIPAMSAQCKSCPNICTQFLYFYPAIAYFLTSLTFCARFLVSEANFIVLMLVCMIWTYLTVPVNSWLFVIICSMKYVIPCFFCIWLWGGIAYHLIPKSTGIANHLITIWV